VNGTHLLGMTAAKIGLAGCASASYGRSGKKVPGFPPVEKFGQDGRMKIAA
jgi:hypothetical protein